MTTKTTTKPTATVSHAKPKAAAKKPSKQEAAAAAVARMRQAALDIVQPSPVAEIVQIPVNFIHAVAQVRTEFDDETIRELASDIADRGIIQPILVRRTEHAYVIVAGERRFRAAKLAGLEMIPAIVTSLDNEAAAAVQIAENIQREDLSLSDTAKAVRKLYEIHGSSVTVTAEKLHKSKSWVSKHLAISAELSYTAKTLLEKGVTEDLEIVIAVDKIEKIDWHEAYRIRDELEAGNAGRKTVLDALAAVKQKQADEEAARAAARPAPLTKEQEKEEKKKRDERAKQIAAEQEAARLERERSPMQIQFKLSAGDFALSVLTPEHRSIIEAYLAELHEEGKAMTSSKRFIHKTTIMAIDRCQPLELAAITAGYLGEGFDLDKLAKSTAAAALEYYNTEDEEE